MSQSLTGLRSSLATARWAQPLDTAHALRYRSGDIWLGLALEDNATPIGYKDDRHVCLVSSTRGGKGTTTIVNNLCLWPGSCVVIDPKGENATITAGRRGLGSDYAEGIGQKVYVLDPFGVAQVNDTYRACFNPLDLVRPEAEESIDEANFIADALVVQDSSSDPHWNETARALIKGLILHVATAPEYEGIRNLTTIRSLLTRGDWIGLENIVAENERRRQAEEELEPLPDPFDLLWFGMTENQAFHGIVSGTGHSFISTPEKERGSILSTARRHTEFIDSPAMTRSLEQSDFSLSELKTDPRGISVFICLPSRYMNTHAGWLRMLISLTIIEMEKTVGQPACGHHTLMLLDEFAALKKLEILENAVAQLAGYGLKMFFVLQSLPQLKNIYKENWETFIGNASLKIFFNVDDSFTRKYLSEFIGETEITRETRNRGTTDGQSETRTTGTTESFSEGQSITNTDGVTQNHSTAQGSSTNVSTTENFSPGLFFAGYRKASRSGGNSSSVTETYGSSESTGVARGMTETTTRGKTLSDALGTSHSVTEGRTESLHKVALVTADEIGKLFARIDAEDHLAYPGMTLILISGHDPIALRKSNYYQNQNFIGLFDPHPDHTPPPLLIQRKKVRAPGLEIINRTPKPDGVLPVARFMCVSVGDTVRKGDPLMEIAWGLGDPSVQLEQEMRLILPAPVSGQIVFIEGKEGEPLQLDSLLVEIEFSSRLAAQEEDLNAGDPFYPFDNPFEKFLAKIDESRGELLLRNFSVKRTRKKIAVWGGFALVAIVLVLSFPPEQWLSTAIALAVVFGPFGGYFYLLGLWSEDNRGAVDAFTKQVGHRKQDEDRHLRKTKRQRKMRKIAVWGGYALVTIVLILSLPPDFGWQSWLGTFFGFAVVFGLSGGYFYLLGLWSYHKQLRPIKFDDTTVELPADWRNAAQANRKVEAIKLLRKQSDLGLRRAMEVVEAYIQENRPR